MKGAVLERDRLAKEFKTNTNLPLYLRTIGDLTIKNNPLKITFPSVKQNAAIQRAHWEGWQCGEDGFHGKITDNPHSIEDIENYGDTLHWNWVLGFREARECHPEIIPLKGNQEMKVTKGANDYFVLEVPAARKSEIAQLMAYRGAFFSTSASTREKAVLFSPNPYAFADLADPLECPELAPYRQQIDLSHALDGIGTKKLPPGVELWEYQKATLDFLLARKGGINGDQPGLGKTIVAIAFCNEREAQRVLVIVPASVRIQWGEQIRRFSTISNVKTSVMLNVKDGIHPTAHYQIISYDSARNPAIIRAIAKDKWDVLICDEAHKLKNIDALTTRAVLGNTRGEYQHGEHRMKAIAGYCREHLALTGTLLLNRPSECLGALTQVLTHRGWIPIVKVRKSDLLWDGVEWVGHHGLLYQGCATTVSVGKISATATHRFRAKSTWVKADEVPQNTALFRQLLASGSANLPYCAMPGTLAALKSWNVCVIAGRRIARHYKNFGKALSFVAAPVVRATAPKRQTQNTMSFVRTLKYGNGFSGSFKEHEIDAPTQKIARGKPTEGEAFAYGLVGSKINPLFWNILFHCRDMMTRLCSLIVPITIEAMSPEICSSSPEKKTWVIGELSRIYTTGYRWPWKKSKCSEPVYDLANVGPRQRFTILTAAGPVISHNCYNLIRFFDHEAIDFATEEQFKNRYNRQADMKTIEGKRFKLESTSLETELQNRLRVNAMARHTKAEALPYMKPPRFSLVTCEENKMVRGALDAEGMLGLSIDDIQTTKDFEILGHIAEARRLMGLALAPQIVEYARDFLEGSDEKLVIFGWHIDVLTIFEEGLAQFGTVRVDGRKSPGARQQALDDFIGLAQKRVFIGNMQSAGTGLDGLQTVCSRCYIAEADWVPAQNEQAVARLDRIGQREVVNAEIFVAPGSLSEKILVRALEKMNIIHKVLDARADP